ncbi:MAG: elongation factor P maturation arginine rhamnosyltransferase EarP [Nitrosomonadales bacterium]|nr:elongation factor P maturation arginine rhamnosyltransferase EarP [Nitrosomonadales bacterium]
MSSKRGLAAQRCDIFCNVVDNFGDIGVSWRLARQLAAEYGYCVRLWVDDLPSLSRLCNAVDASLAEQCQRGVEICRWRGDFSKMRPAGLVIEAFGCALPESYIDAMAELVPQPVWINLEYLSAEAWIQGCHGLPSPHPRLPLTKYYFFPGFTEQTGGLLLERDLLQRRDVFQRDAALQQAFWQSVGIAMPAEGRLKISLFGYENAALFGLLQAWAEGAHPVLCLVPEGRILPQIGQYFGDDAPCVGKTYIRGDLQVRVLPFVEQERYDELLWACDVNFVRGEDSFVRAQWAGKPLVWQIYPQHDAVHWEKLQAFGSLYNSQLSAHAAESVQALWRAWNMEHGAGQAWPAFAAACAELQSHAQRWSRQLADNNLALNLLDFSRKIGRMRAFEIEGQ